MQDAYSQVGTVEVRTPDVHATLTEREDGGLTIVARPVGDAAALVTEQVVDGLVHRLLIHALTPEALL